MLKNKEAKRYVCIIKVTAANTAIKNRDDKIINSISCFDKTRALLKRMNKGMSKGLAYVKIERVIGVES